MNDWFDTDREGLARLLERRGRAWALYELIQNALDTKAQNVSVEITAITGVPQVWLTVTDDDPQGFQRLSDIHTLFATSLRGDDPEKRGRFNAGCKMVLALCEEATVISTKGGFGFNKDGRRRLTRKTEVGSAFTGRMPMTRAELRDVQARLAILLVPMDVTLTIRIDDEPALVVPYREPRHLFEARLQTEVTDGAGRLTRRDRSTAVNVHTAEGQAWLCELGIPVTEIDGGWTIDVCQKLPQGLDRDAVAPAYVVKVQTLVLNQVAKEMSPKDFTAPWVAEAVQHDAVTAEAVDKYLDAKYGDKRVIFDASDPEANHKAVAAGYATIRGGAEAGATWAKIKAHELAKPAGQVFPSPKPSDDYTTIPFDDLPEHYQRAVGYASALASRLLDLHIRVRVIDGPNLSSAATWLRGKVPVLTLNRSKLGSTWFQHGPCVEVDDLLIHEMAHEGGHHLESGYHDMATKLGALGMDLARRDPAFFQSRA
jgi:hypothetical protein